MSYYCQFCDKELKLEAYVVYVKNYITCGSKACEDKANTVNDGILEDYKAKTKEDDVLIFSTKTPDKAESWQIVATEAHPKFLENQDTVAEMLAGNLFQHKPKTKKEMWYCAVLAKDIIIEEPVDEKA